MVKEFGAAAAVLDPGYGVTFDLWTARLLTELSFSPPAAQFSYNEPTPHHELNARPFRIDLP